MKNLLCSITIVYLLLSGCTKSEETEDNTSVTTVIEQNEDGSIKRIGHTIEGKKTGEWKSFVDEKLAAAINYKNGLREGKETWFNKCSGKIIEEGYNESGRPVGLWYRYIEGELVAIKEYKADSLKYIYHNPKFKNAKEIPPPPPNENDCDELQD